jgi:hypothetical protein
MSNDDCYKGLRYRQRVQVKAGITRPDWATTGLIVSLPAVDSPFYGNVLVRWDLDLHQRHVPADWLEVIGYVCPRCNTTSNNPEDGKSVYCSKCRASMNELE